MLRPLLIAGALALAACATDTQTAAAQPEGGDCFRSNDIQSTRYIDDQHFSVHTFRGDYIVTVASNARTIRSPDPLIINTPNGWICTGNGLGVSLRAGGPPPQPLFVQQIARAPETPAAPATPPAG